VPGSFDGSGWRVEPSAAGNGAPVLSSLPGAGFMEIGNSLFADNDQPACRTDTITAQVSAGGNVFRPGSGCPVAAGDVETTAPLLGDRATRNGLVFRAPLAGSVAIDVTTTGCPAADLVGTIRPRDGNDDGTALCDAGTIEFLPETVFADGFED
jgi:hypothetical protein